MKPRDYAWLALIVIVGLALFRYDARRQGRMAERLHAADSVAKVRLVEQKLAHDSAVVARLEADSLRAAARREVKRDAIIARHTDSVLSASATGRADALRMARDSASTLGQLRDVVQNLVAAGSRDSASFAQERLQHQRSILALTVALTQDSLTIQRGVAAELAAVNRSLAAEVQVRLLKSAKPSAFGNAVRTAGWLLAGFVIGRATR